MSRTTGTAGTAEAAESTGSVAAEGSAEVAGAAGVNEVSGAAEVSEAPEAAGSAEAAGSVTADKADKPAEAAGVPEPANAANAAGSAKATDANKPAEADGAGESGGATDEIEVRDHISVPDADGKPVRGTRRFPMFTKDTARPEGGGRAAPREAPAPVRQWPILAVLSTVGLGLLLTALDAFRVGTILIGVALLAGAALRWAVRDVGMLAVRSRFTDMVTYIVLGTTIVLLALMAQPRPLLEIPFLKDTLHFTVGDEEAG